MKKGELIFTYKLGKEALLKGKTLYNEKACGLGLRGKVIDVIEDKVKLHLDIDKEQDIEGACYFDWTPATSNHMYCMPEKDTYVYLNLQNRKESSAKAIVCDRTNGGDCGETKDSQVKIFENASNKKVKLTKNNITFTSFSDGDNICN